MNKLSDFNLAGTNVISESVGKMLVEEMEQDVEQTEMLESFKEDNDMANSADLYTTVMGNKIYYSAYNRFQPYFDASISLTPGELGLPAGAGAYKIPKVTGSPAVKIADGAIVNYLNDNKGSVTLETETYGQGTKITRRLIKRGAKGFIQKLMNAAGESTMRLVCKDIANGMVSAALTANTVTDSISYDTIEDAKYNIVTSANTDGELYGFYANVIALSSLGKKTLLKSTDFKNVMYRATVPGAESQKNTYTVWQGLKVMDFDLISETKGGAAVHAIVLDSEKFFVFFKETNLETYDGRLPGTAGDMESIVAIDVGMVGLHTAAGAVITA